MNRSELSCVDWATLIDGLTNNVNNSSKGLGADGDHNGISGVLDFLTTDESLGGVEGDRAHVVATQVLGDLQNEALASASHFERVQNRW